jgi:hypothetical protein
MDAVEQGRLNRRELVGTILWTWLPYCPEDVARAERTIVEAAQRLGIQRGPFELPGEGY